MRWTADQDEVLMEYGHLGAEECRRILHREHGVTRSVSSITTRASRIGASLACYEVCPQCGYRVHRLTKDGWCEACRVRAMADAQREKNRRLLSELRSTDKRVAEARRDYDKWRQRNSRAARSVKNADLQN